MISKQRLIVFLTSLVSFLAKNLAAFFIVASLIDGYILIVSTDAIVTSYFFNPISSSVSFRSESWMTVYFKAKRDEVVEEEDNSSFDVSSVFKDKCTVVYICHSEYIKEHDRCEGYRLMDHYLSGWA